MVKGGREAGPEPSILSFTAMSLLALHNRSAGSVKSCGHEEQMLYDINDTDMNLQIQYHS